MATMKCKHCGRTFKIECPTKDGTYKVTCPFCKHDSYFRISNPKNLVEIECPSCHVVISATSPTKPGRYKLECPSCKREIRIQKK